MARKSSTGRPRRRSKQRRASAGQLRLSGRLVRELSALTCLILAVVSLIALLAPEAGVIIHPWRDLLALLLGWGISFAWAILAGFALLLWMRSVPSERLMAAGGATLVTLSVLGLFHLAAGGGPDLISTGNGGGWVGATLSGMLVTLIGGPGGAAVLVILLVVGLLLYFNMTIGDVLAAWIRYRTAASATVQPGARSLAVSGASPSRRGPLEEPPLIVRRQRPETGAGTTPAASVPIPVTPATATTAELENDESDHLAAVGQSEAADAALEGAGQDWQLPALDLLADAGSNGPGQMDLAAKGQQIRDTLASFDIGVKVARIQEGPVVTQYALDVEPGIKLSRIQGLADNLALALAARSIRIEAPIPGEPYVGVEIPNTAFDLVTLKEVLASPTFEEAATDSRLAFALGQDVAGQPYAADLARMPHVLISGATGSGKSVCVNAIVCSLLMRSTPAEVKLIMLDPKRVEMAQYRGIPHLLTEVIVDPEKAVNALKWTVATMESRYHEFALRGVRNVSGYNEALRPDEARMPYIVVVIDELADLMMVSAFEVEATITRIAQLARATGIHLVVATQRPSVQVVTGLIKANIPSRIAFAMTSGIDSRTILDTTGAEDLLGRGDMLYQPIDAPRAVRLQGVLVTDREIEALARFWRAQGGPRYRPEITAARRESRAGRTGEEDDADPLLTQAIATVRRSDRASASLLQRRLRVGYARAARILDQMEDRGIVGPADGSRFREVLITSDGWGGEVEPDEEPD